MPFQANVLNVMIASPGDVAEERRIVTEEIHRWNAANARARSIVLLPVKWETHSTPQYGEHPQQIINRQLLEDADIVIGIFGTRIGTPTEEFVSGTVEEIKKHVAARRSAKIYFSDVPVSPSAVDPDQYASVRQFRLECEKSGLYATYSTLDQFRTDFHHHLDLELNQAAYLWLRLPDAPDARAGRRLTADALTVLKEASRGDGTILAQIGGAFGLQIGDKEFEDGTPRTAARWRAALKDLEEIGAVERVSDVVCRLTDEGYRVADAEEVTAQAQTTSQFDIQRDAHIRDLIQSGTVVQRDLLRLLLLKGGSARMDVFFSTYQWAGGFDANGTIQPWVQKGIVTREDNLHTGYATVTVNRELESDLKKHLFPRKETQGSTFKGVD